MTRVLAILVLLLLNSTAHASLPNIVIILADDLGYGDARCYNPYSRIPTPHIDSLARDGMLFTDAHSTSSVCTPTRYALLTGRYSWRGRLQRGVLQGYDPLLIEPGRETIASMLKQRGYATAAIGKWHLGFGTETRVDYEKTLSPGPNAVGFDTFFGIPSSLDFPPYVFVENDRPTELPTIQIAASEMRRKGGNGFWRAGSIAPGFRHGDVLPRISEKAVRFIRAQNSSKPFFLYFPLTAPHTPWMPTAEFLGKSKAGWYGDFVTQTDDSVGRVLAALREKKLEKATLVILTSDNGAHWLPEDIAQFDHRSNLAWRGQKADIHEAGHRVPFIARWPGRVPAGKTCSQLIGLADLFATACDLTGASPESNAAEDSVSILPLLTGKRNSPVRESLVHHSGDGLFALRQGKWKFVEGLGSGGFTPPRSPAPEPGGPTGQLYDLSVDPQETNNQFLARPEVVSTMKDSLARIKSAPARSPRIGGEKSGFVADNPRARPSDLHSPALRVPERASFRGIEESGKHAMPNIVLVYADDLGYGDLSCYGNKKFKTPNLDRLAAEGIRFTDFYVAQPVCSASRAALLTGCYSNRIGILGALNPRSQNGISPFELTMGEMLKSKGYATAVYGKWHLGNRPEFMPTRHGFDEYYGLPYSNDMWPRHPTIQDFPQLPLIDGERMIQSDPDQSQLTSAYTERAKRFIEKNRKRPFFIYIPHSMPHVPIYVSSKHRDKSGAGLYGDVIREIDWSVGEILATLKKHKLDRNTLVMFSSDNGPWLSYGNHAGSSGGFREGKGTTFEGGVRVPFIARWPERIPGGKKCSEPAITIDLLPTLAGIVGAQIPTDRTLDGKNIWPLISGDGRAKSPHEALFFYWNSGLEAMRSGKWKLHFPHEYRHMAGPPGMDGKPNGYRNEKIELSLYDLENDPTESVNVAAQNPDVVRRLTEMADRMRADLGDSLTGKAAANARAPGKSESPAIGVAAP